MHRRGFVPAVTLALLLMLVAITSAQAEDYSIIVPENCWPMKGGNPSRSGYTRTRPLRGALHVAWRHEFKGDIEGEPLVWDDTIVVSVRISEEKRALHLLSLKTGKSLGRPTIISSGRPLLPSLWRRHLAIRDAGGIALYRVGRMKLSRVWKRKVAGCFDLQLVNGKITYCTSYGVLSCARSSDKPGWESRAVPQSYLVQDRACLHFLAYDFKGYATWFSGEVESVSVCHHQGEKPTRLAVTAMCGGDLFIRTGLPMELKGGGMADTVWLRRRGAWDWTVRTLLKSGMMPVGSAQHRVVLRDAKNEGWQLVHYRGPATSDPRGRLLASRQIHPELLRHRSMTLSREVLYLGPARIDLDTLDLFEPLPVRPVGRVIPARDALLVTTDAQTLVCLREGESEQDRAEEAIRPSATEASEQTGWIVELTGRVKKVKLSWAGGAVQVAGKPLSTDKVLLVRAGDGTIAHAGSVHAAREGLGILIENEEGRGYAKLATAAVKALDASLATRFIAAAEDRGATKDVTTWTRRRVAELISGGSGKKPKKKRVDAALEAEAKLLAKTTSWIWQACEKLEPDTAWHVRAEFLRAVLERDARHRGAMAAVRSAIPEGVPLPETFDATRWLMLADAVLMDPVRIAPLDGPDGMAIRLARLLWRKDVIGLRSKNLLILTPDPDPTQVATCLAKGEFVCRKLEELFGKAAEDGPPLVLHLFPTREGYLNVTVGPDRGPADAQAEASAGHYSPRLNLSRIFLPGGEEALAAVTRTYQHELVHHWLQTRCPLPRTKGVRGRSWGTPGFWLVEGIAELFGEFEFDLRRRAVTTQNPRSANLDIVAHAPRTRRIPWPTLIGVPQAGFRKLHVDDPVPVPVRWRVGLRRNVSAMVMFYAQAGATAQYLYHRNSKTRAELVDLVRKYYEGTLMKEDLEKIAGFTPNELGRKVLAYALR